MGRRGRKRRLALEDEYWRLLADGFGTFDACGLIGIGRKTGYRWRAERGGLPPVRLLEHERSSRYLSLLERHRIATLRCRGDSIRAIAHVLGRAPSTISRELQRNMASHDRGGYDGDLAHARARARATHAKPGKLQLDHELRAVIRRRLLLEWSPEQIAAWLRSEYPLRAEWHLCHETIYQALYAPAQSGLSRELTTRLRTGRPLRRRRRRASARTPRFRAPGMLIDERPAVAAQRARIGDWEGDLIVGRGNGSTIGTVVDRRSRKVILIHLPRGHGADEVARALRAAFEGLNPSERQTLTWDQGPEMASHDDIADLFSQGVYFAHPGAPWQRPTNENTNRLLRQYFPKGSDLSVHDAAALAAVQERLNQRPRKILGWRTPEQTHALAVAS